MLCSPTSSVVLAQSRLWHGHLTQWLLAVPVHCWLQCAVRQVDGDAVQHHVDVSDVTATNYYDIGHKPYRPRPYRPQTKSATDHIGHSLYHFGHNGNQYRPQTIGLCLLDFLHFIVLVCFKCCGVPYPACLAPKWPPAVWSVFEVTVRTNNDCEEWHARLYRKTVNAQLPMYKLIDLLYRQAKVTNVSMKLLSESKQQRIQTRTTAHIQRKLAEVWAEDQAGTRSVDGALRACSRIYYIWKLHYALCGRYGVADIDFACGRYSIVCGRYRRSPQRLPMRV